MTLQGSGADLLLIAATPKFAAQAIRKSFDLGWNAVRYITNVSVSVATVLKPAGLDKSKGLITGDYGKDPTDAALEGRPGHQGMDGVHRQIHVADRTHRRQRGPMASALAATMVQVLKQCGNDLSRDNVMKQAANLKDLELPMLLPGMKINTSPDQFQPDPADAARTFDGQSWELVRGAVHGLSDGRPRVSFRRAA